MELIRTYMIDEIKLKNLVKEYMDSRKIVSNGIYNGLPAVLVEYSNKLLPSIYVDYTVRCPKCAEKNICSSHRGTHYPERKTPYHVSLITRKLRRLINNNYPGFDRIMKPKTNGFKFVMTCKDIYTDNLTRRNMMSYKSNYSEARMELLHKSYDYCDRNDKKLISLKLK